MAYPLQFNYFSEFSRDFVPSGPGKVSATGTHGVSVDVPGEHVDPETGRRRKGHQKFYLGKFRTSKAAGAPKGPNQYHLGYDHKHMFGQEDADASRVYRTRRELFEDMNRVLAAKFQRESQGQGMTVAAVVASPVMDDEPKATMVDAEQVSVKAGRSALVRQKPAKGPKQDSDMVPVLGHRSRLASPSKGRRGRSDKTRVNISVK